MLNDLNECYFSTKQAAKACGLSPTTLIRMQKEGLVLPTGVGDNKYRRYETHEICAILQFLKLKSLGLSKQETYDQYYGKGDIQKTIDALMQKRWSSSYCIDELEFRYGKIGNPCYETLNMPDLYCYTRSNPRGNSDDVRKLMRDTFHSTVSRGCRILADELVFISVAGDVMTACIPIDHYASPDSSEIHRVPGGRLFALTANTSFDGVKKVEDMLLDTLKQESVTPIGNLRFYSALTPYADDTVKKREPVMRVGVLIE